MLKVKPIVLALVGIIGTQAYAVTDNGQQLQQQIDQIIAQQQQLQAQVASLKQQLAEEKTANQQNTSQSVKQSTVRIGSYMGVTSDFGGDDLVPNMPNVLLNEALLKQRYQEDILAKKAGDPSQDAPYVQLGGLIEGQGIFNKFAGGSYSSDADLTGADLYMNVVANKWISGLSEISYDNNLDGYLAGQDRVAQSRLYINKAFITFGNLMYSPAYGSIGQMYLPFGRYSYYTVSSPLTKLMARTKARTIDVGYYQTADNGFDTSAYVFQATGGTQSQQTHLQNAGLDATYHFKLNDQLSGNGGVGYINNFADSQGMLDNGCPDGDSACPFRGFGWGSTRPVLHKNVGGYDAHGTVNYNQFTALAEYVSAATRFDSQDLSYQTANATTTGAKPSAFDAEGIYHFVVGAIPSSFVLDYGFTRQAVAMQLPKTRYGSALNFNIWRDTLLSLEYRHEIYYGTDVTGTGEGASSSTPVTESLAGKSDNVVTAQFDLYF